ncbi:hypothetical protein PTKIN_Ptkin09bG0049800 [Pterospermum kingtungense]
MLSGVKFIPRDHIDKEQNENSDVKKKRHSNKKEKHKRKKRSSGYSGSSDDDLERIKKGSRSKKWYSSEEYSSESGSGSEGSSDRDENRRRNRKKNKRSKNDTSEDELSGGSKKRASSRKKHYSSSSENCSSDEDRRGSAGDRKKKDYSRESSSLNEKEIERKEMGLEWMLRPAVKPDNKPAVPVEQPEEPPPEEIKKVNPRELNPYLKDNGTGYPEEADEKRAGADRLLSSSVVGDGGASWRLKTLKRAEEQAAREGRKLEDVVLERWGSLDILAEYGASRRAAAPRAHLHAIRNRKQGQDDDKQKVADNESERNSKKGTARDYLRDVSLRHSDMRAPKVRDSLSWGKQKIQNNPTKDVAVTSAVNKFSNDGNFMQEFLRKGNDNGIAGSHTNHGENLDSEVVASETNKPSEDATMFKESLSTNQLAAKALQLRLKGKHEEAEKLLLEIESMKAKQSSGDHASRQNVDSRSRYVVRDVSMQKRKDDDDTDKHLARRILQNKQYSVAGQADDEYDYEDGPSRKSQKKGEANDQKASGNNNLARRILTQQERCLFCFENPNRPKHLVVAIANFTYLMLPQWQPVVPGHCCILPMQHESATRTIDNNVWDEIRNFKKCLIMMFAKQDKEMVFLETVMGLAQQRRHCLIECIPLPRKIAKQAPVYFKKAIDEAEDEWSQHNAKKLIDTSEKGLHGSIPKNFPYFHVEFGLNNGFVHVIDDESQFKSSLGLNVIRGMLQLAEEDMYRRRRHQSVEDQKQAVASFAREWEPFDWTKQLD